MSLKELFDQLSLDSIIHMIDNGQEEHLQLDFKRINNSNLNGADDKKTIAKSISGFVNSSGGIIIWGIDARKNDDGVDCAVEAVHLSQLATFISRLNEISSQAVMPMVEGIKSRAFDIGDNTGFAATLVPESDAGPHMAKLGEDRYYKRNGQNFYKLEHFDLEDMFGRRQKPNLEIEFVQKEILDVKFRYGLEISVSNVGRNIAKYTSIVLEFENIRLIKNINNKLKDQSHLNEGKLVLTYEEIHSVIHVDGMRINIGNIVVEKIDYENEAKLIATISCASMKTKTEEIVI